MPSGPLTSHFCPWLGSEIDRVTRYGYPSEANICYSPRAPQPLTPSHQEQYCLSARYETCPHFAPSPESAPRVLAPPETPALAEPIQRPLGLWIGIGAALFLLLAILALVAGEYAGLFQLQPVARPTPTARPTRTPTPVLLLTPTLAPIILPTPQPTHTPLRSPTVAPTLTPTLFRSPTVEPTLAPSLTPARATLTATPTRYRAPRLLSPADGATVGRTQVELRWEPVGDLSADEWYDVQVWTEGEKPHGIGWSKEGRWVMAADLPAGRYQWRIVVIRGRDGKWIEDLSLPSDTWTLLR